MLAPTERASAGRELRALLRLAAPIAVTQAGFASMGLVDTAVVGRVGEVGLAAVGLASNLFFALAILGVGVMLGLDPLLSQAFGAGDERRARHLLWQGVWLSLLVSCVLAVPIALLPLALPPAGIADEIARPASHCLWLRLIGLWPLLLFSSLRSYLQAAHRVRALVVATVFANVVNLLFDLWLVFGGLGVPPLGAEGSAIATVLASFVQAGVLFFVRGPSPASRAPVLADLRRALRIGLPAGLQMGAEVSVFSLVGVLAARLGSNAAAAHQLAIALASFTFCAALGVGQAGSVRVGWAVGARDTPRARRAGLLAFGASLGVMAPSAIVFAAAPALVARVVSDQPAVIAAAVPLLGICAVFQLSDGVQAVGAGVLRGAGDTRFAFFANVLCHYGLGLPLALALAFPAGLGVVGLWWGLCAGLTAVAASLLGRFLLLSRREIVPLEEHPSELQSAASG